MWEALAWPGLEHLVIRTSEAAIEADGLVVALDQRPIRLRYRLRCDLDWTTDLTVDPDGLVVEYPELWRRRWPAAGVRRWRSSSRRSRRLRRTAGQAVWVRRLT
jgi:hypothetical protein